MDAKIIPDSIRDVLDYDPETGDLTWKVASRGTKAGTIAGCLDHHCGYIKITYQYAHYRAHRIAWFLYHGEQPSIIDHINRDRADNRIANLRSVTQSQNVLNQGKSGVTWQRIRGRRYAMATYKCKSLYTGINVMVAHYRRIMAERADHPIGLPAPV